MTQTIKKEYIVVEHAGYEGEQDVFRSSTFAKADRFMSQQYEDQEEIDKLHVMIACEINGERTYEI